MAEFDAGKIIFYFVSQSPPDSTTDLWGHQVDPNNLNIVVPKYYNANTGWTALYDHPFYKNPVLSQTNTPPVAPSTGDRYLVGTNPDAGSVFENQQNKVAEYTTGGTYSFQDPFDGMFLFVRGASPVILVYSTTSGAWESIAGGGGGVTITNDFATNDSGIVSGSTLTHDLNNRLVGVEDTRGLVVAVATLADLSSIPTVVGRTIYVTDASDDPDVQFGWGLYRYNGTDWQLLTKLELSSLNVADVVLISNLSSTITDNNPGVAASTVLTNQLKASVDSAFVEIGNLILTTNGLVSQNTTQQGEIDANTSANTTQQTSINDHQSRITQLETDTGNVTTLAQANDGKINDINTLLTPEYRTGSNIVIDRKKVIYHSATSPSSDSVITVDTTGGTLYDSGEAVYYWQGNTVPATPAGVRIVQGAFSVGQLSLVLIALELNPNDTNAQASMIIKPITA